MSPADGPRGRPRVLVLGDTLAKPLSGIGWYTQNLLEEYAKGSAGLDVRLARPAHPGFSTWDGPVAESRMLPLPLRSWRRMAWELGSLPRLLARERPDLIHAPGLFRWMARAPPRDARVVLTLHDVTPLTHPQTHKARTRMEFRWLLRKALARVDGLVTVSEDSRRRIEEHFPEATRIPVRVVHNGVDAIFRRPAAQGQGTGEAPYFLFVGQFEPRKNIPTLLRAFAGYRKAGGAARLRIVGPPGWKNAADHRLAAELGLEGAIDASGFVPRPELPGLYAGAVALVLPSLYEGFGLPVAEAMAAGCPVVTSNQGALPEVAGEAGLLFDPFDVHGIAAAMRRLETDGALRESQRRLGLRNAERFSWDKTARETLAFYKEVLEAPARRGTVGA